MRKFFEWDEETGMISFPETPLFPDQVEGRAEQIMKALDGLKVCSALRLLDLCKDAVMQCPIKEAVGKPSTPDSRIEAEACYQDYISGKATLNEVREKLGLPRCDFPGADDLMILIKEIE